MDIREIRLEPKELNRSISPEDLTGDQARILKRIVPTQLWGRIVRGPGAAKTQVQPTSAGTTVTSVFVGNTWSCKKFVLDGATNGTIRMTISDGSVGCVGPLPLWDNTAIDEDAGVDQAASSGYSGYSGYGG